jgi:vacuolar protein sorting-associated protein 41
MQALGSHNGFAHILDLTGKRIKTFKPHTASVVDICFDTTADFIGTASMDGEYSSLSSLSLPNDSNQDRCSSIPFLVQSPMFST